MPPFEHHPGEADENDRGNHLHANEGGEAAMMLETSRRQPFEHTLLFHHPDKGGRPATEPAPGELLLSDPRCTTKTFQAKTLHAVPLVNHPETPSRQYRRRYHSDR